MARIPLTANDIDCFFEDGELAVDAIFDGSPILVIYREDYINLEPGIGIDNQGPMALAKIDDVPDIKQGDNIDIDGELFLISGVKPAESEAVVRLFLEVI